jgi:hypothetical protein
MYTLKLKCTAPHRTCSQPHERSPWAHLVLALHALDVDVEVQLAHAADDGLAALCVVAHAERGVFALEPALLE